MSRSPLGFVVALVVALVLASCAPGEPRQNGAPADSSSTAGPTLTDTLARAMADTAALPPAEVGVRRLLPVDEAARVPDFEAFRTRLRAAVAAHDTTALLAALHPQLKVSFGGDDGIENFRAKWNLGSPDSPLWRELETVLALGGSFRGDSIFTAPYTFSEWPEEIDAFEHMVLLGRDVPVRAAPRADAAVIGRGSFEIVDLPRSGAAPNEEADGWIRLQWRGQIGYVPAELVRFPLDYRAIFSRTNGVWRVAIFVAGD